MHSPTAALLWEIWRRNAQMPPGIAALTAIAWIVRDPEAGAPGSLTFVLAIPAFLLLFAMFTDTESVTPSGTAFPARLFRLPVSSLRLVAVPMLAAVAAIEVLYLAWMPLFSAGGPSSAVFVAVLMGAWMVFYQGTLALMARLRVLRLVALGGITIVLFAISLVPSFPPTPAPWWRSEFSVAMLVAALAGLMFLLAWRQVGRARTGAAGTPRSLADLLTRDRPVRALPPFAGVPAAQFWFEWRNAGVALPAVVAVVVAAVIAPMSWLARDNPGDTFRLLLATLAAPVVVAIPLGMAFAKVRFWAEDLSMPAFLAVRPLSSQAFVAAKVRVALVSVLVSWLIVLLFGTVWLSLWGNLDRLPLPALPVRVLIVIAAILLTWRFLVNRLWSGLSARRPLVTGSAIAVPLVIGAGVVLRPEEMVRWIALRPEWWVPAVWSAVAVKAVVAAWAWRRIEPRYLGTYALLWLAGTAVFIGLGLVIAAEQAAVRGVVVPAALLVLPLARVGLAPWMLARNRHR